MKKLKNILVITYWEFDSPLITTYTLPYLRIIRKNLPAGSKVVLLTLSLKNRDPKKLLTVTDQLAREGITLLNFNYDPFGVKMLAKLIYILFYLVVLSIKHNISYLHAWCTPGGAIGYLVSVFARKPLILDSFEPHAESMVETGTWPKGGFAYRILFWFEKQQVRRASHVIYATESMETYVKKTYAVSPGHYYVKPACVDLEAFRLPRSGSAVTHIEGGDITCVYAGKFGGIYLTQEVFDFFKVAHGFWGKRFKVLLLTPHENPEIDLYCKNAGLERDIVTRKFVPHHEIAEHLSASQFAICPVKPVPTKRYCTPIKNGEYWAAGLPVVITQNISDDSDIIERENAGYVLRKLDDPEYLIAVKKIDDLLNDPQHHEKIRKIAEKYRNFEIAEKIYRLIYA